ncbi:MAG TPA: TetR/AcrR family transcriptional regulator [Candidatus Dormibacteraeota bacterium]
MITQTERSPKGGAERPGVREALLAATERLILEKGARGLTTREIARAAGCSDGALYVHFEDKAHLLASLCERWLPDLRTFLGSLIERVGAGNVEENLRDIATRSLRVYREMVPTTFAIAGDPELLAYHRQAMRSAGRGPRSGAEAIAAYISAEQRLGRVRPDADAPMAANVLMGSCWQRAALGHYFDEDLIDVDDSTYARDLAAMLMRGLHQEGET